MLCRNHVPGLELGRAEGAGKVPTKSQALVCQRKSSAAAAVLSALKHTQRWLACRSLSDQKHEVPVGTRQRSGLYHTYSGRGATYNGPLIYSVWRVACGVVPQTGGSPNDPSRKNSEMGRNSPTRMNLTYSGTKIQPYFMRESPRVISNSFLGNSREHEPNI